MRFQIILLLVSILFCFNCQIQRVTLEPEHVLLQKACTYLWNQQSADGGWHSTTHGVLRGGESLTPFILHALLQVPHSLYQPSQEQQDRALAFIRTHINEAGVIGLSDPDVMDYPNYATAHALLVLKLLGHEEDKGRIKLMSDYLLQQQFTETRGFTSSDTPYGGWGFGEENLAEGKTGHVDLSHTRRILEALRGHHQFEEARKKAICYFSLAQKRKDEKRLHPTQTSHKEVPYDGGFFASPVTLSTNKGGIVTDSTLDVNYFRSYSTATCDGVLGLLSAGFQWEDEPVKSACEWLDKNPLWDYPQGIPLDDPDQWQEVMIFYHLAVRSEVFTKRNTGDQWKVKIYELLNHRQEEDGHFSNPMGALNKEDDPLLATAFAVITLSNSL